MFIGRNAEGVHDYLLIKQILAVIPPYSKNAKLMQISIGLLDRVHKNQLLKESA